MADKFTDYDGPVEVAQCSNELSREAREWAEGKSRRGPGAAMNWGELHSVSRASRIAIVLLPLLLVVASTL
ncbi:MAG: hypothetical protein U9N84_01300, partial [Actinomycetota bacterium]|nr:hypothetical protein [Actinomycetota bacterium]